VQLDDMGKITLLAVLLLYYFCSINFYTMIKKVHKINVVHKVCKKLTTYVKKSLVKPFSTIEQQLTKNKKFLPITGC